MFSLVAIALSFVSGVPSTEGDAGTVPVDIARPFEVGQVFSYAAVGRCYRQTVVSTRGAVLNQTLVGMRCELAAGLAIEAVRDDGRPQEISLRVFRLAVREGFLPAENDGAGEVVEEPLEEGAELKMRYPESGAGEPELSRADGGVLEERVSDALRLVLPGPAGTCDGDVMFGRLEPAEIGEVWAIDAAETAKALLEGGIEVPEDRLSGEVSLQEHDPQLGQHVVQVVLKGERAGVPLPRGYVTRAGTLDVRLRTTLPDEPGSPLRKEESEYSLKSQAMGREGEQLIVVDLAFFQSRSAGYDAVGGAGRQLAGGEASE